MRLWSGDSGSLYVLESTVRTICRAFKSAVNVCTPKHYFHAVVVNFFRFVIVGEPVKCTAWLGQCVLYILIMMFEKVVIMLVLLIPEWKKVRTKKILFINVTNLDLKYLLSCICQ